MKFQSIFSNFFEKKDDVVIATSALLKAMNISVTETTLKEELLGHPNYPSLLSISDTLKKWNIRSLCINVLPEKITELPVPFIGHMNEKGGVFYTIHAVLDRKIIFTDNNHRKAQISTELFLRKWDGIVLLAEGSVESGETDYQINAKKEKLNGTSKKFLRLGLYFLMVCSFFSIYASFGFMMATLMLVKILGVLITVLLLTFEIDPENSVVKQVCGAVNKTDCTSVLRSKGAKIFDWLSWSEIGFFYFSGGVLFLLMINGVFNSFASLNLVRPLAFLNVIVLPFVFYSFYYQFLIIKQWCLLCIAVQALLICELMIFLKVFNLSDIFITNQSVKAVLFSFFTSFLLPIIGWVFIKKYLIKAEIGDKYKIAFARLKNNSDVFNVLLKGGKRVLNPPEDLGIILGNPSAQNTIIKVCNPYCIPCANAHLVLDKLINEGNVKVQVIFSSKNDYSSEIVQHLISIDEKNDKELTKEALHSWYAFGQSNSDLFKKNYSLQTKAISEDSRIKKMNQWCDEAKIEHTPTIFLNGYALPSNYSINDMRYFLE